MELSFDDEPQIPSIRGKKRRPCAICPGKGPVSNLVERSQVGAVRRGPGESPPVRGQRGRPLNEAPSIASGIRVIHGEGGGASPSARPARLAAPDGISHPAPNARPTRTRAATTISVRAPSQAGSGRRARGGGDPDCGGGTRTDLIDLGVGPRRRAGPGRRGLHPRLGMDVVGPREHERDGESEDCEEGDGRENPGRKGQGRHEHVRGLHHREGDGPVDEGDAHHPATLQLGQKRTRHGAASIRSRSR